MSPGGAAIDTSPCYSPDGSKIAFRSNRDGGGIYEIPAFGGQMLSKSAEPVVAGCSGHEMGGARVGRDPSSSVLNGLNQAHDAPNLFVTDGASMTSSACQNPSLTYMALTARACDAAVSMLKESKI